MEVAGAGITAVGAGATLVAGAAPVGAGSAGAGVDGSLAATGSVTPTVAVGVTRPSKSEASCEELQPIAATNRLAAASDREGMAGTEVIVAESNWQLLSAQGSERQTPQNAPC